MNQQISWAQLGNTIAEVYELIAYIPKDLSGAMNSATPVSAANDEQQLVYNIENSSQFSDLNHNAIQSILAPIIEKAFAGDLGNNWFCAVNGVPGQEQPQGFQNNELWTYNSQGYPQLTVPSDLENGNTMIGIQYKIPMYVVGGQPLIENLPTWLQGAFDNNAGWGMALESAIQYPGQAFGTANFYPFATCAQGALNFQFTVDNVANPPCLIVNLAFPASDLPNGASNNYPLNGNAFSGIIQGILNSMNG